MLATGFGHAVAAEQVTIISLGRNSQAALSKAFYGPFNAATGTHVKAFTYDGSMSFVEDMVNAGKPTWDVVEVQTPDLVRGCEQGLLKDWTTPRSVTDATLYPAPHRIAGSACSHLQSRWLLTRTN